MSDIKDGFLRISAISSAYASYGTVPQTVLDKAASRGERVHGILFDLMNFVVVGEDRYEFMGAPLHGYVASFRKFYEPYQDAEVMLQEHRLYDDELMITGEPDLLIKHQGKTILMDWKCTSKAGPHWQIQAEGYCHLLSANKLRVDKIYFVRLDRDGKDPEVIEYKPEWKLFMKAYDLYKIFFKENTCNLEME